MLTPAQIRWAKAHDWFVADLGDGVIVVLDCYVDAAGELHSQEIFWRASLAELRGWAGY